MNTKQFAIDYLNGLADEGMPSCVAGGLCSSLEDHPYIPPALADKLIDAMASWPEGTGDKDYPVPSATPASLASAQDAARREYEEGAKWANTPYGNSRRRLCKWLADELANGNIKVEEESYYEQI